MKSGATLDDTELCCMYLSCDSCYGVVMMNVVDSCQSCCCYSAVNPMFGDYFQHDAHELLCCMLTHIDDAVAVIRRFHNTELSTMTSCQLYSPRSCQSLSSASGFSHDMSCENMSFSPVIVSTPPSSARSLSPTVNDDHRAAEESQHQSVCRHWRSLPSSPCTRLVVDLCMPRKCSSLGHLSRRSQQQLLTTVTISPELLCDRLKRKRNSSHLSLINLQCTPRKCKNFASYCFSASVDNLHRNCDLHAANCSRDPFVPLLTRSGRVYSLSKEFLSCSSGDCVPVLTQLTNDTKLPCFTDGSPVSVPATDDQCSLEVSPRPSVKDQLLLSLQAIESGRSCNISLCCEDVSVISSVVTPHRDCMLDNLKTSVKRGRQHQHIASVRDMFAGQMLTLTKCLNCRSVAKRSELYEDIAVFTGRCVRSSMCHILCTLCYDIHM